MLRAFYLAEREAIKAEIDKLYWTFTRCARGKPPILVRPDLHERLMEINRALSPSA